MASERVSDKRIHDLACGDMGQNCSLSECEDMAREIQEMREADRREREELDRPWSVEWLGSLDVRGVVQDGAVWTAGNGLVAIFQNDLWLCGHRIASGPTRREVLDLLRSLRLLRK